MNPLTHFDAQGQAHMVDVAAKPHTHRIAVAGGRIEMQAATLAIIEVSSASVGVSGGRIPGRQLASRLLPAPGGPIISKLQPPVSCLSANDPVADMQVVRASKLRHARSGTP